MTKAKSGDPSELLALADGLISSAEGSEQIEVIISRGESTTVKVHSGEVEALTSAGSAAAGIRVVRDGRPGFATCGTLDPDVLAESLAQARENCEFAEADEFAGIAEPDGVEAISQDLWADEVLATSTEAKIAMAIELESMVVGADPRVKSARTTTYGDGWGHAAIASTSGIRRVAEESSCSVGTQPLAVDDGETQIGWGSDASRDPEKLDLHKVADEAVDRATKLLGAMKPKSAKLPIVLEPRLAITLLGIVSSMLSAEAVQKGRSPFADRLGEKIGSPLLTLWDDPTRSESLAADEWDREGLACRPNQLLDNGRLCQHLFDSTTARRGGTVSTGSAVGSVRGLPGPGPQLLVMEPGETPSEELLAGVKLGLAVESFAGLHSGVNPVSGDFSVGADGLMIRDGAFAEPVRELTVASTIQRLLSEVSQVGDDFEWLPSGSGACSVRIDDVSISGS